MLAKLARCALLFLLAIQGASAGSLPEQPRFERVGAGVIPRDVVAALAQDKTGLIWIATGDGLVRFDGYRFRPLERESPIMARRNLGWIRALLPTRDGCLWIGTESDGLSMYDPRTQRVLDLGLDNKEPINGQRSSFPTIRALAEDLDGSIWVGSVGGGVARWDAASRQFTHYRHSSEVGSLPDDRVQALLVDRDGSLWVGGWNGLTRLVRGGTRFEPVASQLVGAQVQALHQASNGGIWVGTHRGDLVVIDPATAQGRSVTRGPDSTGPNGPSVSAIAETPDGEIWVGSVSGVDIHDRKGRALRQLRYDIRKPAGLAGHEVSSMMLDRAGWMWVGGFGIGLQRHNPNNHSIWLRGADLEPGSRLADPSVRSLLQLDNGEVWAATSRGGVAVLDHNLQVIGEVNARALARDGRKSPAVPVSPRVTAMAQTRDGSVWLGMDNALFQVGRNRQPIRSLPTQGGATHFLLAGNEGSLWAATGDGLYRWRPSAFALERVVVKSDRLPLQGAVHVLASGPDGDIWVGTVKGLYRLPHGQTELVPVLSPPGAELGNASIAGLLFDSHHTLWVDTGVAGLHRMSHWDGQLARFDRISERHGIVNRPFGANLMQDQRGRIWTQIHVYDPATDRLTDLTAVDGADLGTGWFGSYALLADGRMLFGGSKGVLVVQPESFDTSGYAPPLVVSEMRVDGQMYPISPIPQDLRIESHQRSFSLEFAALDYSDPVRIRYAYRLDGFDQDWISGGSNHRLASYGNLDPGTYTLHARATNRNGVWSPHELAIRVTVLPRWWQQWWFRMLALLLAMATIHILVRWRTRRLRLSKLALEEKVQQRTAELQRLTTALQESSLTDPLTGLRNRRFLTQHIASDVALTVRAHDNHLKHGATLAVDADLTFFMFDIDHFKDVNDRYGHAAGDAVLTQMCGRLQSVFRDTDYLVRWGGEEFLVVARGTSREFAAELAERARAAVAGEPFDIDGGLRLAKTCSIGFASFPLCLQHPTALGWATVLNVADANLFAVKHAGRDGWIGTLEVRSASLQAVLEAADRPIGKWGPAIEPVVVCSPGLADRLPAAKDGQAPDPARDGTT